MTAGPGNPRASYLVVSRVVLTLIISGLNLALVGCSLHANSARRVKPEAVATAAARISQLTVFQRAIDDAADVSPDAVSHLLFPLNASNDKLIWQTIENERWVKVAAWMSRASYERYYADNVRADGDAHTPSGQPIIWATLVPQVKEFCRKLKNDHEYDPAFRLKQYLGLDPNRRYERFVELWVRPRDIFRPCPDPEPDDFRCETGFARDTAPRVRNVEDYVAFFNRQKVDSYNLEGAPWTRLGYTYDWAYGTRGMGASEYMIVPEAPYRVDGSYTTEEYCRNSAES